MASSTSSTTTSVDTLANSTSGTAPEPSLTTCTSTTSSVLQSTTTLTQDQLNVIRQQIVPELRGEIRQAVTALRSSPTSTISPDSTNLSGTLSCPISVNNSYISDANAIHSVNDSLGLNVSQNLKEKIINGEYVDLGALLVNSTEDQSNTLVINNGQLQFQQKSSKKIVDLNTWLDAFLIYTSIYTTVHPESIQGLLKYMYNIRLGASRCSGFGWREYDKQFRLKKAKNQALAWGTVDQELWLLYMHNNAINMTSQQFSGSPLSSNKRCFEYNYKGKCAIPYCRYQHRCLKCNNPHPSINCRVQFSQSYNSHNTPHSQIINSEIGVNKNYGSFDRSASSNNARRGRFSSRQLPTSRPNDVGKNTNQN